MKPSRPLTTLIAIVAACLALAVLAWRFSPEKKRPDAWDEPDTAAAPARPRSEGISGSDSDESGVPDSERYSLEQSIELPEFPAATPRTPEKPPETNDASEGVLL